MLHPNILAARHREEAVRLIRAHKYECMPGGILIPDMKLAICGAFEASAENDPWEVAPNMVVTEGLTHLIAVALAQGSQKSAFYIALFGGAVSVAAGWTGANFTANSTEFTNYTQANRVLWDKGAVSAGSVGNSATPATFTMHTGGGTIRGAGLLEASAKSATTGVLVAAARLAVDKVMSVDEDLRIRYTISAVSS